MKTDNIIEDKSFNFAIRIVNLYKFLKNKNEHIISKQLLRSGTSVGANVAEGIQGQSKKDFVSKLSIALKEANETIYWISLLKDANYIDEKVYNSIQAEATEILKMLISIVKTSKQTLNKK